MTNNHGHTMSISKYFKHFSYFDTIYKNPLIFTRLLNNYFRKFVLQQKRLRITDIALTFKCNANCHHCSSGTLINKERTELTLEEFQSCIKQAIDLGSMIFNFLGGEPLVYEHIYEVLKTVKKHKGIAGISSNGLLLTKTNVKRLKDSGLDVIQVDCESIDPLNLDKMRRVEGCWEKIEKGLQYLKEENIKIILSTILTKENIASGEIFKIVEYAKRIGAIINVNCSVKVGNWSQNNDSLLTDKELKVFQDFMKMPHTRWAGSTNFSGEFCPCGTEKLFISAYGDVIPCGFMHIAYGNIRNESLRTIWHKMHQHNYKKWNKKVCRAAFDPNIIDINALNTKLPIPFENIKNKIK